MPQFSIIYPKNIRICPVEWKMKGDDSIRIQIIGSNCSNGIKLSKMVSRAIEENSLDAEIEYSEDEAMKKRYKIRNIPGLVIDNKLVSEGKVLSVREIKKLLLA